MAANPMGDTLILGAPGIEGKTTVAPSHAAINAFTEEKHRLAADDNEFEKSGTLEPEIKAALPSYDSAEHDDEDHVIITGADAAAHLLPMRDDQESALTFRSIFLATILSAFQAVVYQIYMVCILLQCYASAITNIYTSLSRPSSQSRELSLFLWLTFSVMHGPEYYLAETNSRLDGELRAALARSRCTSR